MLFDVYGIPDGKLFHNHLFSNPLLEKKGERGEKDTPKHVDTKSINLAIYYNRGDIKMSPANRLLSP